VRRVLAPRSTLRVKATTRVFPSGQPAIGRVFDYGQDVAGGISEPGNGRAVSSLDPFSIRFDLGQIILLEPDASFCQFVDGSIDIGHGEIQYRERGWNMVGLRINENVVAPG
jgi:hypothetical protein